MHSLSSSEVWLCEALSSLLFDLLPLPNISFDTAASFFLKTLYLSSESYLNFSGSFSADLSNTVVKSA